MTEEQPKEEETEQEAPEEEAKEEPEEDKDCCTEQQLISEVKEGNPLYLGTLDI